MGGSITLRVGHGPMPPVVFSVEERNGVRIPRAPCRMQSNPDIMFPENGSGRTLEDARAVCEKCPIDIRTACFEWALENKPEFGVWAGYASIDIKRFAKLIK